MTVTEHTMQVRELSGDRVTVECDCGWEGRPVDVDVADDDLSVDVYAQLEDQWDSHCDAVFEAATSGGPS